MPIKEGQQVIVIHPDDQHTPYIWINFSLVVSESVSQILAIVWPKYYLKFCLKLKYYRYFSWKINLIINQKHICTFLSNQII